MGRLDRLKEYQNPRHGPQGAGRDQANLDYWADCAKKNSQLAPRASDGPMKLPSTKVNTRDTAMGPKVSRNVDALMRGRGDLNHVTDGDSKYLATVRRKA